VCTAACCSDAVSECVVLQFVAGSLETVITLANKAWPAAVNQTGKYLELLANKA
jgi:hypothetical protein